MALNDAQRQNFATLLRAAKDGRLALLECNRKSDGKQVALVCAISDPAPDDPDPGFNVVPFGALSDNAYAEYDPPEIRDARQLGSEDRLVHPEGLEIDEDAPSVDIGALT